MSPDSQMLLEVRFMYMMNWVSVRWYYTGNQRLIIAAGWQSGILHNELVLYICVYSPRIARSCYIEIQGQL